MKGRFISGIVAGSLIGATAGMYAITRMSPRQRRKAMKVGRRIVTSVVSNIGLF
ncbi:YtxH domain-containing protein [Proteiniborus sp. MB09-C3]|uniref:YtxH domain-containing protein n=1 Tax=Proteiniborus sp. MB09-C3 TaxID=3050072 RepID=UPI00255288F2|nr:YtxH domain-containing protein [Proteiniborus sp. MB09-C3]WIV11192.1 YtxH domain-containing protein [Proteiniborus sp. MB09-C3]